MRSTAKKTQCQSLGETKKPYMILGTGSHLDDSIYSSETFPPNCEIFRKDRNIHDGGVFVAVKDSTVASSQPNLSSHAE